MTQSKPVQYLAIAFAILLVIWGIKKMFTQEDISDGLKAFGKK